MSSYEVNATLTERIDFNAELSTFWFKPDDPTITSFEPGQYAELAFPELTTEKGKLIRRQYSIASAPSDDRGFEFYIVLVPEGALTPKLWELQVGGRVWINPKCKGKFTLDPVPDGKDLVMIATGTGLAPFLSMWRRYNQENRWRRFIVIHGARYECDLGYRAELEKLAGENESFFYIPTLTREESKDWQGHRGRVPTVLEDGHYEEIVGAPFCAEECHVFLCGNPQMIDDLEVSLAERGFRLHKKKDPGNLHIERYW